MGYGIVDREMAASNTYLADYEFSPLFGYWLSSRMIPVYDDPRRVMEDMSYDENDIHLDQIAMWDPAAGEWSLYTPDIDLWGVDPWDANPEWSWDYRRGYSLLLEAGSQDQTLTICGNLGGGDDNIPIIADAMNFVAYFPDWEDDAPDVLTSIDDYLDIAKGYDGSFYVPDWSFSNLTMKPVEGYQLWMDTTSTTLILSYPATQPASVNYGGGRHRVSSETSHFRFRDRTGDFLPVLLTEVEVEGIEIDAEDEIAVFYNDTLCVGAALIGNDFPIGFAAWRDNPRIEGNEGFVGRNRLSFRYWDASEDREYSQESIQFDRLANNSEQAYWLTNAKFGSSSDRSIPTSFQLLKVYPNPFNSQFNVEYKLTKAELVSFQMRDINGRIVNDFQRRVSAGAHSLSIDGEALASGTYLLQISTSTSRFVRKVQLIR